MLGENDLLSKPGYVILFEYMFGFPCQLQNTILLDQHGGSVHIWALGLMIIGEAEMGRRSRERPFRCWRCRVKFARAV